MPIILHETIVPAGEIGLWRIAEPEAWFLDQLLLYPPELRQLSTIKGRRRTEWLAVRQLVHDMSGRNERGPFVKDVNGKPHLLGSTWQISISHSHGVAAAMASPVACGIDIQVLVPKITRLAPRFLSAVEVASLSEHSPDYLAHIHVYWGAKEALYKAYGRRQIDFREHLQVAPFAYSAEGALTTAQIVKDGECLDFQVVYRRFEQYLLVYVQAVSP